MAEKKQVVVVDPSLEYQRRLHYMEKHSGWMIFKSIYWGIYAFLLGVILLVSYGAGSGYVISPEAFLGWALVLFAIFYIVFGFTTSLHLKLMKKHG